MTLLSPLLADVYRTYHEFARLDRMTEWWHWMTLVLVCGAVIAYVVWVYASDSVELRRGVAASLLFLRILAFAGILFTFLGLEKRGETQVTKPSRVVVLVDTSQSMSIHDAPTTSTSETSRLEQVVTGLAQNSLIAGLRQKHHVVAVRFDQSSPPVQLASLPNLEEAEEPADGARSRVEAPVRSALKMRRWFLLATVIFATGILLMAVYTFARSASPSTSWLLFAGVCLMFIALTSAAAAHLTYPDVRMSELISAQRPTEIKESEPLPPAEDPESNRATAVAPDWVLDLRPQGTETRLGEALRYLIEKERGGAIAGIVVLTDGNSNSGLKPELAAALAKEVSIPLFPVGLGSDQRPINVKVADLLAPERVFPGDAFNITGLIQAHGLEGRTVKVGLYGAPDGKDVNFQDDAELIEEQSARLTRSDEITSVKFEVVPHETGRRVFELRIAAPKRDQNANDNRKQSVVRVVERNNRILLLAGGPTREYRFVRNLLYRDPRTTLHVLLQTAHPGVSQEADKILFEFPSLADELFQYDAVVAFDPDWTKFDRHQVELLERWVAEKAGGVVVVAGPVHAPFWTAMDRGNPRVQTIKALYPVVFFGQSGAAFHLGRTGSDQAWPLEFTPDGDAAEFLWLDDTARSSRMAWAGFSVYGFFAAKNAKPGAHVYARFSDPDVRAAGESPVYLAGHFYGAGRVFYMASGEMWRLRSVDVSYFEKFYTKLIRYVSQGRLLRDSSRGLLMVDKDRCLLGDSVTVRAVLSDSQHKPLAEPGVPAVLITPQGGRQTLTMQKSQVTNRQGMYTTQFSASLEGDYRIELPIPDGNVDELLVREVRVRLPDLEVENPQRNDPVLKRLAQTTDGIYFVGMDAITPPHQPSPLVGAIAPQDQVTYVPGVPDKRFDEVLMSWLLAMICGALSMEWLLRRLHKLA